MDVRDFLIDAEQARRSQPDSVRHVALLLAVVDRCTGDLLEDFDDECLTEERRKIAEAHLETLRTLTRKLLTRHEYADAQRRARQLVHRDSVDESHHGLLMEARRQACWIARLRSAGEKIRVRCSHLAPICKSG